MVTDFVADHSVLQDRERYEIKDQPGDQIAPFETMRRALADQKFSYGMADVRI